MLTRNEVSDCALRPRRIGSVAPTCEGARRTRLDLTRQARPG